MQRLQIAHRRALAAGQAREVTGTGAGASPVCQQLESRRPARGPAHPAGSPESPAVARRTGSSAHARPGALLAFDHPRLGQVAQRAVDRGAGARRTPPPAPPRRGSARPAASRARGCGAAPRRGSSSQPGHHSASRRRAHRARGSVRRSRRGRYGGPPGTMCRPADQRSVTSPSRPAKIEGIKERVARAAPPAARRPCPAPAGRPSRPTAIAPDAAPRRLRAARRRALPQAPPG